MSDKGDIRVNSLSGYCLDNHYRFYPEDYLSSKFMPCFSESSTSTASQIGKFDCMLVTLSL